jgi:ArsR family transcriptional regulator
MEEYIKIFSAFSNKTRLRIFLILTEGELCVCELTRALDMEQSRISHSLRVLREARLINSRKIGKWMFYSINENLDYRWVTERISDKIPMWKEDKRRLKEVKSKNIRKECNC